jgi:CelD/BcsL family acetyltransferase involved in cellulose biosynthesis/GT2 family glycosyltransferase
MTTPDVSIVVCTQNRADLLRGALSSLYDLVTDSLFSYEVVVIDNASSDETPRVIAAAAAESNVTLRGFCEPVKGIVPARNRGIREAQGRWIAFFDDDQLADQRWLAELHSGAAAQTSRVVGGSVLLTFPGGLSRMLHPAVRMLLGEAAFGEQPQPYGGRLTPGCGNLMIERSVFDEVGVFERTVSGRGEDTDLFSRIERAGIAAWYLPTAVVHHLTPPERLETAYLLSLARRMGEGVALRQFAALGPRRFANLWLAKTIRTGLVQWPLTLLAAAARNHDLWLGRRCLLEINWSFARAGRALRTKYSVPSTQYSVLSTQYLLHLGRKQPPKPINQPTQTMTIHLKRPADLTADEWALWLDFQQQSLCYESPYFRPEFTQAVAAVRDDVEIAVLREGGQTVGFFPFQRGKLGLGKPVGGKLSDYHGPLVREGAAIDPQALLAACRLASWDFDHFRAATDAFEQSITVRDKSPQMELNEGYETYLRRRREAGSETAHRQGQKTRKLGREVGALAFAYQADDEEAFNLLCEWKSAQFVRTGLTDVLSLGWTRTLLARLREFQGDEFSAPLSVLRAGDKVAAVCLSLRSRGVLHSWFTAYNPELHAYSPGLSLFLRLAEDSQALGIRTIDLGRGDERYKWSLASTSVEVGEGSVCSRSFATLLRASWRQTRDWVARSPLAGRVSGKLLKPIREWVAYG